VGFIPSLIIGVSLYLSFAYFIMNAKKLF